MEDRSIHHSSSTHTSTHDFAQYGYDGSYEWPWDSTDIASELPLDASYQQRPESSADRVKDVRGCLRVLVSASQALPSAHRIGLLDGFTEIQFGRDATDSGTPRVRLKEMEVSKLHATIYWDQSWKGWGIVDMGSKHGTFLRSFAGASTALPDDRGVRLSTPKSAGIPRRLYHSDEISIGSTTFVVHIHEDGLPCEECSPTGGDEIPLFHTRKTEDAAKARHGLETTRANDGLKAKMALTQLKRDLLSRHGEKSGSNASRRPYIDRSALRRAMRPSSEAPGATRPSSLATIQQDQGLEEQESQPEVPIPPSSIGHKLLLKQGWEPGTSLGLNGDGRIDPVDLRASSSYDRAGLGLKTISTTQPNWKGNWKDKYSRWNNQAL
ncbi:hypothetical protein VKT23_011391 [Stygiomarasmius scandens]|uniref:Angiogenic factor with G patch and FHA domains 1 n=1 Tax=Marasmiellus scandens TaxID=2682957 RepID=A0ABR1J9W7_9AGAR